MNFAVEVPRSKYCPHPLTSVLTAWLPDGEKIAMATRRKPMATCDATAARVTACDGPSCCLKGSKKGPDPGGHRCGVSKRGDNHLASPARLSRRPRSIFVTRVGTR